MVKRSAVAPEMQQHSGPARVFNSEETAIAAIYAGPVSYTHLMEAALNSELNFLQKLCGLTLDALLEAADRQSRELAFLPRWL